MSLATLALLGTAYAAEPTTTTGGDPVDIELVRPTFSDGAMIGLDSARLIRAGALRVGAVTQYERDILILYQGKAEVGAVVANRQVLQLGLSWQPLDRLALRLSLPMATQWGSEVPEFGGDGVGAGDLSVGTRFGILDRRVAAISGSVDLYIPTGAQHLWMGESSIRADVAALTNFDFGPLGLRARIGTTLRTPVDTTYDLVLGSELAASGGVNYTLLPERLWLQTGLVSRTSYSNFFDTGETVAEWLAGAELGLARGLHMNLGIGRGLTPGYGTSQVRAIVGVVWHQTPPPPKPEPVVQTVEITPPAPVELTEAEIAPEPEPPPKQVVALAEVVQDQIVIRDPIQFEFATDHILPESMPTLQAIAKVMNDHPEVLHVVIEGHASDEGSYVYNYKLSLSRSISIFAALVEAGVNPDRISCRAMGEVKPVTDKLDETSLAMNRRVEFHIVRRLQAGEAFPDYGKDMKVPWTGESRPNPTPPPAPTPVAPPEAPTKVVLPGKDAMPDFSEEEEESPAPPAKTPSASPATSPPAQTPPVETPPPSDAKPPDPAPAETKPADPPPQAPSEAP